MKKCFVLILLVVVGTTWSCGDELTPSEIKQCQKYCEKMQECDRVSPLSDSEKEDCIKACSAVAVGGSNTTINTALTQCASLDDCDEFLECALENVEPLWENR